VEYRTDRRWTLRARPCARLGGRGPNFCRRRSTRCIPIRRATGRRIAGLYAELARLTASPVVELNRAIAVAETEGPEEGRRIVDRLGLDDFRYLHSTRGASSTPRADRRGARRLPTCEGTHRRRRRTALHRTTADGAREDGFGLVDLPASGFVAEWPFREVGRVTATDYGLGRIGLVSIAPAWPMSPAMSHGTSRNRGSRQGP
jgi:hypothetical protein